MKYFVHYGYYECGGIKIFDNLKEVREFRNSEYFNGLTNNWGKMFDVYEIDGSVKEMKIHEIISGM